MNTYTNKTCLTIHTESIGKLLPLHYVQYTRQKNPALFPKNALVQNKESEHRSSYRFKRHEKTAFKQKRQKILD